MNISVLENKLRFSLVYDVYIFIRDIYLYILWSILKLTPPPHIVKKQYLRKYAKKYNIKVLVETGTQAGAMIYALRKQFDVIYSIELSETLFLNAKEKLSKFTNIHLIKGDSGKELKKIISTIKSPALFWLDAHYSGERTAYGESETPIIKELEIISTQAYKDHIILIDDARNFDGKSYPALNSIYTFVHEKLSGKNIFVENDMIIIE